MSKTLCERLVLTLDESNMEITNIIYVTSAVHRILKEVPLSFSHVIELIDVPVIGGSPQERILLHLTVPELHRAIDCESQPLSSAKGC